MTHKLTRCNAQNQGLHHLPPDRLSAFLEQVKRVLRPSGLFIVREHDASPELMPMLDLAHSVFNAVTGMHSWTCWLNVFMHSRYMLISCV